MQNEVTLMEAYLIEALKGIGKSDEAILADVRERQAKKLQTETGSDFDFSLLYQIEDRLEDVLRHGYRVKFLTFPGLQRLLLLQVDKEADLDYVIDGFTIKNLMLNEIEAEKVRLFLSSNWTLTHDGETFTIQSV